MPSFECHIPVRPVGKGRPRFVRATGRTYTPEETASFEAQVRFFLMKGDAPKFEVPVVVEMICLFEKPKSFPKRSYRFCLGRYDVDNLFKAVADAANGILWSDDRQIVSGKVVKRYGQSPGITLSVREATREDVEPF